MHQNDQKLRKTESRLKDKFHMPYTRCLKITEKVSFNIASEASYVYMLSGQKLVKNAKNSQFFENLKLAVKECYKTKEKNQMRHFE